MINCKSLIIRQLELGDEEYLYKWWNDGELMEHATHIFGVLQSKESIKNGILKDIEDTTMFSTSKRFIICKKDNLVPIGEINYSDWDSRNQ
ncbi:MAG: GNAT family N-acetyltransferase, partial [Paraclostridium sp.]